MSGPGVVLGPPRVSRGELGPRVSCTVTYDDGTREAYVETSADTVPATMDAFLAGALAPAMKTGGPLVVHGEVSSDLLAAAEEVQRVFEIWRDDPRCPDQTRTRWRPVEIVPDGVRDSEGGPGRAMFFSGGVDSFATLLARRDELDHLLFIDDFETTFPDALRTQLFGNVRAVADALVLGVHRIRTSIRPVFAPLIGRLMHSGSELSAVAHHHAALLGHVVIAASDDLGTLHPLGTHPQLEPRFSTRGLRLEYDTLERTRMDKVLAIAQSDLALAHLRVCWDVSFNCGECAKCVRTLFALHAAGRLDAATSFARRDLTPERVAAEVNRFAGTWFYFAEIADYCDDAGVLPDYVAAVREALTPRPEPIPPIHALTVLAPEPVRRLARWGRGIRG